MTVGKRSPIQKRRIARRRYVRRVVPDLLDGKAKALHTYALRMQFLGLYSKKTCLKDIKWSILKYLVTYFGYRNICDWFKSRKEKRETWI